MFGGACIPQRVHTIVISIQHSEKITLENLRQEVMTKVIKTVIPEQYLDKNSIFHINPCGEFVLGGPQVVILLINSLKKKTMLMICFFSAMRA